MRSYPGWTDEDALKIHGLQSPNREDDSDSENGDWSDFDEEYARYKPPPLVIDPANIIKIKPMRIHNDRTNKKIIVRVKSRPLPPLKKTDCIPTKNYFKILEPEGEDGAACPEKDHELDEDVGTFEEVPKTKIRRKRKRRRRRKKYNHGRIDNSLAALDLSSRGASCVTLLRPTGNRPGVLVGQFALEVNADRRLTAPTCVINGERTLVSENKEKSEYQKYETVDDVLLEGPQSLNIFRPVVQKSENLKNHPRLVCLPENNIYTPNESMGYDSGNVVNAPDIPKNISRNNSEPGASNVMRKIKTFLIEQRDVCFVVIFIAVTAAHIYKQTK